MGGVLAWGGGKAWLCILIHSDVRFELWYTHVLTKQKQEKKSQKKKNLTREKKNSTGKRSENDIVAYGALTSYYNVG